MDRKTITINIDNIDANILLYLLKEHKEDGLYWGVQKHHYSRVRRLIKQLKEALNG